jgi:hypothetical protein
MNTNTLIANMFGNVPETEEVTQELLEKQASLEVLGNLAEERGIDLSDVDFSDMSADDIKSVIDEVSGDGQEKIAQLGVTEEEFNQAATMGQLLAHSAVATWCELGVFDVEKTAGKFSEAVGRFGRSVIGRESNKDIVGLAGKINQATKGATKLNPKNTSGGIGAATEMLRNRNRLKNRAAAGGALAAAGAGGAYAYKKHKEKKGGLEDFEQDVLARAQEIVAELEKNASANEPTYEEYVNARALELLRENGYEV